nr:hypothetical protein BaRGS_014970 [Batillaria attramentaria]
MRDVTEKRFHRLVDSLHSLKVLRLNDTRLDQVSKGRFQSLTNVTTLYLNKNILTKIPDGTFDDLEHLTVLTLDGNLITSVGENTFGPDMRRRLQSLNLSNNHFECTCSLLWFRKWLQSDPALFDYHNPYSRYECKNIPGSDVATFFLNEQQCLLSHESYIFIVVCFVIFILTLTVVTLLYRYRWHIRLAMYEVFRGDLLAKWRQRNPKDFQYDLFVSYSGEDVRWVIDHLIPGLEDQMGLRLCVHQRDFILGNNISDNIMDSLESSKRVLALFSRSFASSQWCQFEMELCLRHVIDNNDVMVVVLLEDVESRDLSGAMLALMKTTTYIEWGAKPEAVESFWRRMALALNDVLPGLH